MSIPKEVKPINQQIKEARISAGKSVVQLASEIGITRDALYKLESAFNDPQIETLRRISKATECNFFITNSK